MNLKAMDGARNRARRAFPAAVMVLAMVLMGAAAAAQSDPFVDFHIFDPVRGVKGSFIGAVKADVGPIDYLEKISPAISHHSLVRVEGWLYSPKMPDSNTGSVYIIYSVLSYPSEAAARDVMDAVFGTPFVKAFKAHTDEFNRQQHDLTAQETRHSRDNPMRFRVRNNDPAYPPGKKWITKHSSHYFMSYEFNGPGRPCSQRQVIKQTEYMYVFATHYWVTGTRQSGLYVNSYIEMTNSKIISGQGYYRLIRSGAYVMVIKVFAQSKILDSRTNEFNGTASPPDLLAKYWQIVEGESRRFVCNQPVASNIVISLSMPSTKELTSCRGTVFGPAFPDFRTVHLTGRVTYEGLMEEGDVCGADLTVRIINNGKVVLRKKTTTDAYGWYEFSLPVNRKGSRRVEEIRRDIIRRLRGYALPPETLCKRKKKKNPYGSGQGIKALDWKNSFWNRSSALNAMWKDFQHQKYGGKGTPNLDQWMKNHEHGRDIANALQLLIDVATSPATASAQMIQNANTTWKWLTGKPLPFVTPGTKNSANTMKKISQFYQHFQDLRNAGAIE